jgi:hypothetical protein
MSAWSHFREWNDTQIASYFSWVADNYQQYNGEEYLCNWWPLRLLVEYAASHGLRVRLAYWPGSAPTTGGKRHWDTSKIYWHDSQSAQFSSKPHFYGRVKSTVTARMIGALNTERIQLGSATEGDLLIYDLNPSYWHAAVIVRTTASELISQSGTTPKVSPGDPSRQGTLYRIGGSGTDSLFENAPRRWRFSQFSTTP